jgi:hypothetical protein
MVGKLTSAFNNGFSIKEACVYAGINNDTYFQWVKSIKGFSDLMEAARLAPNQAAKKVIIESIRTGDVNSAKYWLDRRDPDFRQKGELDINHGLKEIRRKIGGFLDATNDQAYDDGGGESATANVEAIDSQVAPTTPDIS